MAITLKYIAKRAGTSISTVSRVVANDPRISAETTQKIKRVMDELGYHPNFMARGLVSKTTRTIGILLPKQSKQLHMSLCFTEMLRGVIARTHALGYDILVIPGDDEEEEMKIITAKFKGRKIDGMILLNTRKNDPVVAHLRSIKVPFVLMGSSTEYEDIFTVDSNNVQAAYELTDYLIGQGIRQIIFSTSPFGSAVSSDRWDGYRKALATAGIKFNPEWLLVGETFDYKKLVRLLTMPRNPSAIIVQDDIISLQGISLLKEMNSKLFKDVSFVSFVSFNPFAPGKIIPSSLTAVEIDLYEIGHSTASIIIQLIEGTAPIPSYRTVIPHRLIVGTSE